MAPQQIADSIVKELNHKCRNLSREDYFNTCDAVKEHIDIILSQEADEPDCDDE